MKERGPAAAGEGSKPSLSGISPPGCKPVAKTHCRCTIDTRSQSDLVAVENRRPARRARKFGGNSV